MRYLVDTNAVIASLNNANGIVATRMRSHPRTDFVISVIVLHELYFGAFRSRQVARNLAALELLRFGILHLDPADARVAADLRAKLAAAGTPIGSYDLLIAAQGLARGLVVVTANTREFARVAGLTIEDWS